MDEASALTYVVTDLGYGSLCGGLGLLESVSNALHI